MQPREANSVKQLSFSRKPYLRFRNTGASACITVHKYPHLNRAPLTEVRMLSKCLNPQCTAQFRYLGEGRLFRIDFSEVRRRINAVPPQQASGDAGDGANHVPVLCTNDHLDKPTAGIPGTIEKERPTEHFWLCAHCAANMTIGVSNAGEVHLVKLPVPQEPGSKGPPGPKLVAAS